MTIAPRPRLDAIDLLRGLVMVIMLLDHTRDFVHSQSLTFDPVDLARTTPVLFSPDRSPTIARPSASSWRAGGPGCSWHGASPRPSCRSSS